jgi:hypothetical protein
MQTEKERQEADKDQQRMEEIAKSFNKAMRDVG